MRKKIISMLLAISVIITGICSCSSKTDVNSSTNSSTSSSTNEVTLKVTETLSNDGQTKLYKSEDLKVIALTSAPTQIIKWRFSKPYEGEDKVVTLKLSRIASSVKAEKESEGHKMADNSSDVEVSATLKNGDTEISFEVPKEAITEAKEMEVELPKDVEVKEVVAEEANTTDSTTQVATTTSKTPETTTVKETTTTPATTKKPEETKAPETTATTTVTTTAVPVTEVPKPKWTEEKMDTTKMYVSVESCYAREEAVLGATTSKLYYFADEVDVVAKTNTGYYKLKDGTFIHSDYLVTSKPQTTTAAPATEKPKPQVTTTVTTTSKPAETTPPKTEPKYAPNGEKIDDKVAAHIDEVWTETYYGKTKKAWARCDLLAIRKYPVPYYGTIMKILYQLDEISIIGETNNGYAITSDGYYVYYEYIATEDNANYPYIPKLENTEAKY